MNGTDPRTTAPLNPTQRATFDDLLAVGGDRPYAAPGLVERLRDRLEAGTADALRRWTEPSLWLSKGSLFAVRGCEGAFVASREADGQPSGPVPLPVVVGTVAHRAIQMVHTHPGTPVEDLVRAAVDGSVAADPKVAEFWATAGPSAQSDLLVAATSRTMGLVDAWPPLHPTWAPRFEEPIQVKVGKLTLSGRVDLMLGRPRPDGRQTMVLTDWKSGGLKDDHAREADLYALLSTLRFGVPPFRSVIYSLASGTWTDPDVTPEKLLAAVDWVCASVTAIVDVLTETRPAELTVSPACSWCPARSTCPALAQTSGAPSPKPATAAANVAQPSSPVRTSPGPSTEPPARDTPAGPSVPPGDATNAWQISLPA